MSDWGWIALGYTTVYGILAVYGVVLMRRVGAARRTARGLGDE